jgi:hypothetical protein
MAPGTFEAAPLDFSPISRAAFRSNMTNGFRLPQRHGPPRLLHGASNLLRPEYANLSEGTGGIKTNALGDLPGPLITNPGDGIAF